MIASISALEAHFKSVSRPCWFISRTPIHLLGLQKTMPGLRFLCSIDPFDGRLPELHAPAGETIIGNTSLLRRTENIAAVREAGRDGYAAFLFFDEEVEDICETLRLPIAFPSARLRHRLDDKCIGNRLAQEAGVTPVPYRITPIRDYAYLRALATEAGLGEHLVIQASQGDSGQTTFFVSSPEEYARCVAGIGTEAEVRVMKRIACRSAAVEGCITRNGVLVGLPMNDLTGYSELTPVAGGWCGNEVSSGLFSEHLTQRMRSGTIALGKALQKQGYWGYFEADWLVEEGSEMLYFGEINPRISGASVLSNLTADAMGAPLFLFHVAEYERLSLDMDIETLNSRAVDPTRLSPWSVLIIKHLGPHTARIEATPTSGTWSLSDAALCRHSSDIADVRDLNEGFWVREFQAGDSCRPGDILGRLIVRGRVTDSAGMLTARARAWIRLFRSRHILEERGAA